MLLQLFLVFVKLSLLSFGGGYAMIPLMMDEVKANNWATGADMADTIAIAAMSPGPVAVNASIGLGFLLDSFPGVVVAFVGMSVPCVSLVMLVAAFFMKMNTHPVVQGIMYGLKAVIPGIILFAAVKIAIQNGIMFADNSIENGINILVGSWYFEFKSLALIVGNFLLLEKTKIHPIVLIIVSAALGMVLF